MRVRARGNMCKFFTCRNLHAFKKHEKAQERRKTTKNTCKFFICRIFHTFSRHIFAVFSPKNTKKTTLHTGISCKWRYSKGFIHGLVEVKGEYSISGWNSFFSLFKERFLFISPLLFDPPKTTLFHLCPVFLLPKYQFIIHEIPSQRRAINNKRGSIDNTYIKRKLRIKKKKTTCKTRRNNT